MHKYFKSYQKYVKVVIGRILKLYYITYIYEHAPNKDLDFIFVFNDLRWEMIVPFVDIGRLFN
jgi:hypothetical protein